MIHYNIYSSLREQNRRVLSRCISHYFLAVLGVVVKIYSTVSIMAPFLCPVMLHPIEETCEIGYVQWTSNKN